ncbi:YidH family protein [Thermophagus sp. OGC60D27]|uniref:YidH family protein n=1 Tax=Thermophagus sp. OGC60D27 TaxID=3458415 RepID=UPI004037D51F
MKEENNFDLLREHLANERTFLAWIRTGLALMGFGFVIIKFSFFLQELALWAEPNDETSVHYSNHLGVSMVAAGILLSLFSYLRYRKIGKQLSKRTFSTSFSFSMILTIIIILIGCFVFVIYLFPMICGPFKNC